MATKLQPFRIDRIPSSAVVEDDGTDSSGVRSLTVNAPIEDYDTLAALLGRFPQLEELRLTKRVRVRGVPPAGQQRRLVGTHLRVFEATVADDGLSPDALRALLLDVSDDCSALLVDLRWHGPLDDALLRRCFGPPLSHRLWFLGFAVGPPSPPPSPDLLAGRETVLRGICRIHFDLHGVRNGTRRAYHTAFRLHARPDHDSID